MDPQYPYGQAETEASLAQVLSDQQALAWRAHELWQWDAATAGLHSREVAASLRHLRQMDPDLSPATVEDLRAALDRQLHQLETRVEELWDVLRSNMRRSIKDYWRGRVPDLQLRCSDTGGHQRGELCPVRPVSRTRPGVGEGAHGGFGRHRRGAEVLGGVVRQEASEPAGLRAAGPGPHPSWGAGGMEVGAGDRAPGSNPVTAALIAELPKPVQGLLVHAYRAILRGADVPESWHEAIIWLIPKGTATATWTSTCQQR